jgi:FUN14 domain-containing protein 1
MMATRCTGLFNRQTLGLRTSTFPQLSHTRTSLTRSHLHTIARRPGTSYNSNHGFKYSSSSPVLKALGLSALGLGLTTSFRGTVQCDATAMPAHPANLKEQNVNYPPPPTSSVNLYELSFGTVCGLCAGVFIKKGAKMVAFFLGGVFVLLQYLGSWSVLRVDWSRVGSRFENAVYRTDPATGTKKAPSVVSVWRWLVDFLTADFQPRASFLAGLALGLRVG